VQIDYSARLARLREEMRAAGVGLVFLPIASDLQYLTGIRREKPNYTYAIYPGDWITGAFIGLEKGPLFTVPRMVAQFDMESIDDAAVRVLGDQADPATLLTTVLDEMEVPGSAIAIGDRVWGEFVLNLRNARPDAPVTLASSLVRPLRTVKDEAEIALMKKAGEITDAAFQAIFDNLRIGMTHLDVHSEVEYQLTRHGAEATSFVTGILANGPGVNIAFDGRHYGHDVPLLPGTTLAFDLGVVADGYCSDFGRTVHFGDPPPVYVERFNLVMASQAAGIEALRAGETTAEEVDATARQVMVDGGYGDAFMHRLGHGIGMDVHEPPFLNKGDSTPIREGMVFTIEPSIYVAGEGFIRVEDCVVARPGGGEPLSNFSRELLVVSS
jgi:Xaa-Pro dipeptidase